MNGNKRVLGSDLKRVDASVLTPDDYVDAPELSADWFKTAVIHKSGVPVRRGRPKAESPKVQINIRLSDDVVTRFRATGRGWQTRIDAALSEWLANHPDIGGV